MLLISHFLIGRLSGPTASVIAYFLFFEYSGMSSAQMVLAIGLLSIIAPKIVLLSMGDVFFSGQKYYLVK